MKIDRNVWFGALFTLIGGLLQQEAFGALVGFYVMLDGVVRTVLSISEKERPSQ